MFDVNAKGSFYPAEGAAAAGRRGLGRDHRRHRRDSWHGRGGRRRREPWRAADHGPSFAIELAPRRIRVNAVSPGAIDTPIIAKTGLPPEQVTALKQGMAEGTPFQRLGAAREVATTVAFLLSDDASYVTGENIVVGGGAGLRT